MPSPITRRQFVADSAKIALALQFIPLAELHAANAASPLRFRRGERRTLRAAMDTLIPAGGGMPAASSVGGLAYLERLAGADALLAEALRQCLRQLDQHAGGDFASSSAAAQVAAMQQLEGSEESAEAFRALRDCVYEAYYTKPRIWKLIGYEFRDGPRSTAELEPFDEQSLVRVRQSGRLYREVSE